MTRGTGAGIRSGPISGSSTVVSVPRAWMCGSSTMSAMLEIGELGTSAASSISRSSARVWRRVQAVTFARENGLSLSIKGGGHNVAGHAVSDGGLMLDLRQMRAVWVNPVARTARVQAGALWSDFDRETAGLEQIQRSIAFAGTQDDLAGTELALTRSGGKKGQLFRLQRCQKGHAAQELFESAHGGAA